MSTEDDAGHDREASPTSVAVTPSAMTRTTLAAAVPPLITAPLSVERAPKATGGPAALTIVLDEALRKTGLRHGRRLLRATNDPAGVTCSGCSWPRAEARNQRRLCENGARMTLAAGERREAGERLFSTYTIPELAARSDQWLTAQGRLAGPMVRRPGSRNYEPIAWPEAISMVAEALRASPSPDRVLFHTSGQLANETRFALELFARELGTNNLTSSAQLCHEASRLAMMSMLGTWRSPVTLADFSRADTIFVFGLNPGSNHQRMVEALRGARERGATIVGVNPMREVGLRRARDPRRLRDWLGSGAEIANRHVAVRIGGDLALLEGLCKATLEAKAWDREFVAAHTEGFDAIVASLAEREWAAIVEASGVERETIEALAELAGPERATIACWGVGLTQHRTGVATIEQLLTWLLLNGQVGRPGAGPLAVLGHSNTAGAWSVGLARDASEREREQFAAATGLTLPSTPGLDLPAALEALDAGELDILVGLGGNLLSSVPASESAAAGLRKLQLSVHVATRLNRAHLITGETGLLLPALARHERAPSAAVGAWTSHEDACGQLSASRGTTPGPSLARSELDILAALAADLWPESERPWSSFAGDPGQVRSLIGAARPDYASALAELQPGRRSRVESPAQARRFGAGDSGERAQLVHHRAPPRSEALQLTSIRSHDQHNSQIFSLGDRERGLIGYRRILLMNLDDLRERGIEPYERVDISTEHRGQTTTSARWVVVPHHIRSGCAAAYWPEINALLPATDLDPRSRTPSLKATSITLAISE